jgi:hypothetical protein
MKRSCMLGCLVVGVLASGCSTATTTRSAGPNSAPVDSVAVGVAATAMPVRAASETGARSSASSSPSPTCSGFALSLASDTGGQPSPVEAAVWFAQHGSVQGVPTVGWQQVHTGGAEATVQSQGVQLHVIEGPDQTWQVDSGQYYCP